MNKKLATNSSKKRELGQFFTTNSDYILQGLEVFVKNKKITDPFAGNQDLLNWVKKNQCLSATGFDCDENCVDNKIVFFNDSLNSWRNYEFICTNPPYLHKNKASKAIKEKFFKNNQFEDLYQIAINACLDCEEGIIIVPLNFLSAENSAKIRNLFFAKFSIIKLNIFSSQVFDDTTYNVIAFYFKKNTHPQQQNIFEANIYPKNTKFQITLDKKSNWQFGGEFVNKIKNTKNSLGIFRLTENMIEKGEEEIEIALQNITHKRLIRTSQRFIDLLQKNIVFLRAIDSKNGKKIQLEDIRNYKVCGLIGKSTSRNMAHLVFKNPIPIEEQLRIIDYFNQKLNENRQKYFSFFLTNFRDNNRKRISFEITYKLINLIYDKNDFKQSSLL